MTNITDLERAALKLFRELTEQDKHQVLRILQALRQLTK